LAALSFVVLTIFSEIALVRLPARVDNRRGGVLGCWMLAGVVVGVVGVVGVVVVEEEKHCIRQAAHLEERERRRGVRYW